MSGLPNRRFALLLAIAAIAVLGVSAWGAKSKKTTLTSKLGKVEQQIKAVRQKLRQKEGQRRNAVEQLSVTERQLEQAQSSLSVNNLRLMKAKIDLQRTIKRLEDTRRQLARRRDLLSRRVVDMYEGEDLGYADVVLGASDMWTFLTRAYYLQRILDSDTALIRDIREDERQIEADKKRQASRVKDISVLQVRLVAERDEVAALADERHDQLQAIEHDKELYQKMLDDLEAQSRAIEAQIRAYQSTPRGRARSLRPFRGGLSYPCGGRLTSRFGYRVHPITGIYKLHTGVDFAVPTGTAVHAAADGTVMSACYNRAYGNMVTIAHDGGVSTLYAHNSRLLVRAGQEVKRGQVIARSGSTGYSTGPHVHFEKRVNGTPVNPM